MKKIIFSLVIIMMVCGIASLLLKPDSPQPDSQQTDNSSENQVDFSKLSYACLGDSIMDNFDLSLLENEIDFSEASNYGSSGATIAVYPDDWNYISVNYVNMVENIDIISVMGGTNDFGMRNIPLGEIDSSDNTTYCGALNVIIDGLRQKYPDAFIFFITPYYTFNANYVNSQGLVLEDYVLAMKRVCYAKNVPLLDFYNHGGLTPDTVNQFTTDGVHPTEEFYRDYTAPQIAQFIRQNYK